MAEENTQEFEQEQATLQSASEEHISARTVQLKQSQANIVHADESVAIEQGAAKEVRAQEVSIRQGAAVSVDADHVEMVQGVAGIVRCGDARLGPGTRAAAVLADNVKMEQAGAQFMLARDTVDMDQSGTFILVGQHVTAKDSGALLMFANSVEGNPRVVMDRQMALTFGAAMGAMLGLVLGVFGILRKGK
jgi:hypothetical protein